MDMSIQNENIRKFLEKLGEDPELQAKLAQLRDPEEAYKLASGLQEGFTKEEFVAEMTNLYKEMTRNLSEEDMAKVAGGLDGKDAAGIALSAASLTAAGAATAIATGSAAAGAAL